MEKAELKHRLITSREWNNPGNTALWKQAQAMYKIERGSKLSLRCGKCVERIKEWLNEP